LLSYNNVDRFSSAKVTASGMQCGALGTSDLATWQQFECPEGTTADQIKIEIEKDGELAFCGIKVWGDAD
jgi:hypothetical protein